MIQEAASRLAGLARRIAGRPDPVILMYHRVVELMVDPWGLAVTPANFAAQLRALKRRRRPVSLDEMATRLASGTLERGMVAVTFDDAYRDVLTNAKPLLEQYGVPATVFVVTGKLGAERGFWWDRLASCVLSGKLPEALPLFTFAPAETSEDFGQPFRNEDRTQLHMALWRIIRVLPPEARDAAADEVAQTFVGEGANAAPVMTESELANLTAGGLIDIGAHTMTHPSLPSLSGDDQRAEIAGSKRRLEDLQGGPVRRLAYPFGDYDARSIAIARDLGFDYAVSVETGPVRDPAARFHLPRHDIKNWNGAEFAGRLTWQI